MCIGEYVCVCVCMCGGKGGGGIGRVRDERGGVKGEEDVGGGGGYI